MSNSIDEKSYYVLSTRPFISWFRYSCILRSVDGQVPIQDLLCCPDNMLVDSLQLSER